MKHAKSHLGEVNILSHPSYFPPNFKITVTRFSFCLVVFSPLFQVKLFPLMKIG